tara:strand:- start:457 stop:639 length:183 start_codon:yes stop_codon:yes gene_type:complete
MIFVTKLSKFSNIMKEYAITPTQIRWLLKISIPLKQNRIKKRVRAQQTEIENLVFNIKIP